MSPWWTAAVVVAFLFGAMGAVKAWRRHHRQRALRRVPAGPDRREARDVSIRVTLFRTPAFHGLEPGKGHLLQGDLAADGARCIVASDRGILADLTPTATHRFRSARATGPNKLVLEGVVPKKDGKVGLYRFDVMVDDAPAWARALAPFVDPGEDGPVYGSRTA